MSKGLEKTKELRLQLNMLITVLEDIFAADNEPIKETVKDAKHALKQIPKIEQELKEKDELEIKAKTFEKAFEIILTKLVDIPILKVCEDTTQYNMSKYTECSLKEAEFKFLKGLIEYYYDRQK